MLGQFDQLWVVLDHIRVTEFWVVSAILGRVDQIRVLWTKNVSTSTCLSSV